MEPRSSDARSGSRCERDRTPIVSVRSNAAMSPSWSGSVEARALGPWRSSRASLRPRRSGGRGVDERGGRGASEDAGRQSRQDAAGISRGRPSASRDASALSVDSADSEVDVSAPARQARDAGWRTPCSNGDASWHPRQDASSARGAARARRSRGTAARRAGSVRPYASRNSVTRWARCSCGPCWPAREWLVQCMVTTWCRPRWGAGAGAPARRGPRRRARRGGGGER